MRVTGRRIGRSGCSTARSWDTFAAMGVVRRFAVAGLDEAAPRSGRRRGLVIGALDETGPGEGGHCHGRRAAAVPGLRGQGRQRDQHRAPGVCARACRACADRRPAVDPRRPDRGPGAAPWPWACPWTWSSAPRASWPSTSPPRRSPTASGSISSAGTRSTAAAPQLREFFEDRGQAYVLRVPSQLPPHPARREEVNLRGGRQPAAWPASTPRSAPPGRAPRASAGMPGRGWPPPPRGTAC